MVPLMYVDLIQIAKNLLHLIVKPELLQKCKISKQLAETNLDKKGNMLPINKAELGFGIHSLLSKMNKQDIITIDETKKIKKEEKKKKIDSSFHLFDKIHDFLHTIVFTIQFSASLVHNDCGVVFVNISYFTEVMITVLWK